jgi:uncharacterized protein YciI
MRKPLKLISITPLIAVASFVPWFAAAQEKSQLQFKLVQFYMGLLKKGPKWTASNTEDTARLHQTHMSYVVSLFESGKAMIAGPLSDEGEIIGVYIFRASSIDEAKAWVEGDPLVGAGHLVVEMHPWWAEDVMKKPSTPLKLTTMYLAFLKRGPKWTPEQTPETQELQRAHLANINRLAELKKLVIAGPLGDKGPLAGIFVFRVDSLAEAQELAATDPAVKAGRFVLELHPWQVPEGIFP